MTASQQGTKKRKMIIFNVTLFPNKACHRCLVCGCGQFYNTCCSDPVCVCVYVRMYVHRGSWDNLLSIPRGWIRTRYWFSSGR